MTALNVTVYAAGAVISSDTQTSDQYGNPLRFGSKLNAMPAERLAFGSGGHAEFSAEFKAALFSILNTGIDDISGRVGAICQKLDAFAPDMQFYCGGAVVGVGRTGPVGYLFGCNPNSDRKRFTADLLRPGHGHLVMPHIFTETSPGTSASRKCGSQLPVAPMWRSSMPSS